MLYIENYEPYIQENVAANGVGLATNKPTSFGSTVSFLSTITQTGLTGINTFNTAILEGHVASAINSTATATAAQVATGCITSTSAAATAITLPTGTLLGAALGATAGDTFELIIDNTAGANTVTIAVAVNGILSAAAAAGAGAGAGLLTVPSGVTGIGVFKLMFSSATAYAFSRIA